MRLLPKPEVYVTYAPEKFDEAGTLTDEATRELLRQQLAGLLAWTRLLRGVG
jgi:hypothetical protein